MTTGNEEQIFTMTVLVEGEEIKMKPFVKNTFGSIIEALKTGLKALPENEKQKERKITINYNKETKNHLLFYLGDKKVPVNPFVQDMMCNTMFGFLSTLNGVPNTIAELKDVLINVNYSFN